MNILEKARPENCFRCADGSVLGSVYELENRLCTMSSETFYHHANQSRNDFHNWIRDVFQDYELANELLGARKPAQAAAIVRKHLRKALLAKEEIENAIQTITVARAKAVKPRPAKAAPKKPQPKKRPQQPRRKQRKKAKSTATATRTARAKNRKLNKKRNTREYGKKINIRGRTKRSHYSSRRKKRGKSAHKRIKKQVNKWLNWLKIVPEL